MKIEQLEVNKYDNTSDISLSSKNSKLSITNKKKLLQLFVEQEFESNSSDSLTSKD